MVFFLICATSTLTTNNGLFGAMFKVSCRVTLTVNTTIVLYCAFVKKFVTMYMASFMRKALVLVNLLVIPLITCLALDKDLDSLLARDKTPNKTTTFLGPFRGKRHPCAFIRVFSRLT